VIHRRVHDGHNRLQLKKRFELRHRTNDIFIGPMIFSFYSNLVAAGPAVGQLKKRCELRHRTNDILLGMILV
jgi:hypothetical protein